MSKRRLAVSAVVLDPRRGVLLIKQGRTRHDWELPGGKVKKEESLTDALEREVREETGIDVQSQHLIGIFFIPAEAFYDFVFLCKPSQRNQTARPNPPEIAACDFFETGELPSPMQAFTRHRIRDAIAGKVHALPVTLNPGDWLG